MPGTVLGRWRLWLLAVPIAAGMVATILFLAQGGFGGGHGRYDGAIIALTLPTVLLFAIVPLPSWISQYDYLAIIALPMLANIGLVWVLIGLISWISGGRRDAPVRRPITRP
jgi:hypothetical protein